MFKDELVGYRVQAVDKQNGRGRKHRLSQDKGCPMPHHMARQVMACLYAAYDRHLSKMPTVQSVGLTTAVLCKANWPYSR